MSRQISELEKVNATSSSCKTVCNEPHIHYDDYHFKVKTVTAKFDEDVEKLEALCIDGGNVKWLSHSGKQYDGASKIVNIELPQNLGSCVSHIPKGIESRDSNRYFCAPMFIEAIVIIAKSWKQSRCPSPDERINNMGHTRNEIHSLLNRKRSSDTYYNMSEL